MALRGDVDGETRVRIRDLVTDERVARDKWSSVVDWIVTEVSAVQRIKDMIRDNFGEAVLKSLNEWQSLGNERVDLLMILRLHGMNLLADKISAIVGLQLSDPGVWIEVGEKVYNFTGREMEMRTLHKMLLQSRAERGDISEIWVTGLGGIGKSALVRQYVWHHSYVYDGNVIWINAESLESTRNSFKRVGTRLGTVLVEGINDNMIAAQVYRNFKGMKSLFIFDDVHRKLDFNQFMYKIEDDTHPIPYILVTSRRRDLVRLHENELHLNVLNLNEAEELIQKVFKTQISYGAKELAKTMNGLPLAIQQAVAHLREVYGPNLISNQEIQEYLKKFPESAREYLSDRKFQEDIPSYKSTTLTTWAPTLSRIKSDPDYSALITRLLAVLSYLYPNFVSLEFLARMSPGCNIRRQLRDLVDFSMISKPEENVLNIHRLVQLVIRLSLNPVQREQATELAEQHLREGLEHAVPLTNLSRECKLHGRYMLHLNPSRAEPAGDLLKRCFYFVKDEDCSGKISNVFQRIFGDYHENIVHKLKAGEVCHDLGDAEANVQVIESIIASYKDYFSVDTEIVLRFMLKM